MAGMLLHLAMGDPERLDPDHPAYSASYRRAYALGLLLPDIAKQGFIGSAEDFDRYFEGCSPDDRMTYEEYLAFSRNNHFNPDPQNPARQDTRNPDLRAFVNAGYTDLHKPVWQGVFCHLMGDKAFYYGSCCVDDPRAMADYAGEVGEIDPWDPQKWRNSRTGRVYYDDYNILNRRVEDEYRLLDNMRRIISAPLLQELLLGFHVEFSGSRAEPEYMDLNNIRKYIDRSRALVKAGEAGDPEDILRFFDGDGLADVFR